ncbi:nitroreductase/quinone reductase family protein [Streptomyces sp. H27-G5]|uniref:nitroreductase/quinone reductase family protein n=1 Tax=Streptomyces sp. H27-G5 TaxID=2996698 RepID=UPI002271993B|nr:nitroreductase/quinone reductase family protein [Streptomyces sp. H27-G5]MCY0918704.1 nitroreductase/quinone reductase family protein [Streptomyces sp. H27-G5]
MNAPAPYYVKAGPFGVRFNALFGKLARLGVSLAGTAELSVRGRTSGKMQRIPVNPHTYEGEQFLVSARGHSQWVRNMRVAGGGELRVGRKVRAFTVTEITDPVQQAAILRAYLEKWGWEVNRFFQGVTAKSSDAELQSTAGDHPVFRITVTK